jgi:hypothetical protein
MGRVSVVMLLVVFAVSLAGCGNGKTAQEVLNIAKGKAAAASHELSESTGLTVNESRQRSCNLLDV